MQGVIDVYLWFLLFVFLCSFFFFFFFFSSRRRHTRWTGDWSSDVCSSDLGSSFGRDAQSTPLAIPSTVRQPRDHVHDPTVFESPNCDAHSLPTLDRKSVV